MRDHRAVGKRVNRAPMQAFGLAVEPLGVQHLIHRRRRRAFLLAGEQRRKGFRVLAPAFEAGPVAGRERRHLIEKKQLGVIAAPDVALTVLELEHAADPLPRGPAAPGQFSIRVWILPPRLPINVPRVDDANNSPKDETRFCNDIGGQPGCDARRMATRLSSKAPGRLWTMWSRPSAVKSLNMCCARGLDANTKPSKDVVSLSKSLATSTR